MGKFSKKLRSKVNQQKQQRQQQQTKVSNANSLSVDNPGIAPIRAEVTRLKNEGLYMEAMQEIIKLFEKGYTATEIIYEAAEIYYLMGDYERTIVWGEKTLTFDENYIKAMMLLAKTYMMENNMDKCFTYLDKILRIDNVVDNETTENIYDILMVFEGEYDIDAARVQYPHLADYMKSSSDNEMEKVTAAEEDTVVLQDEAETPPAVSETKLAEQMGNKLDELKKGMQEKLQGLKEKQSAFQQEVPEKAAEVVSAISETHEAIKENVQDKLGDLRASMQEKLQKLRANAKLPQPEEVKETVIEAADKLKQTKENIVTAVTEQTKTIATSFIAEREIKEIMERKVSLLRKLDMLNQQGAILQLAGQSEAAVKMLQAVLAIDDTNEIANKNLGFIYAEAGNLRLANDYFSKLLNRDLMLENYLKNKK